MTNSNNAQSMFFLVFKLKTYINVMEFSCWVLQQYKYVFEKEKKWPALVMICKESELSREKNYSNSKQ